MVVSWPECIILFNMKVLSVLNYGQSGKLVPYSIGIFSFKDGNMHINVHGRIRSDVVCPSLVSGLRLHLNVGFNSALARRDCLFTMGKVYHTGFPLAFQK